MELARFDGHEDAVLSLVFSHDGRYLLSGSIDTSVRLWEVSSGELVRRFDGHTSGVMSASISSDDRYAVTGAQDGSLIVWDLASGDLVRQIKGHSGVVHYVSFMSDGEGIWSAADDGTVKLWEPRLTLESLQAWVRDNRFAPELTCQQGQRYGLDQVCD